MAEPHSLVRLETYRRQNGSVSAAAATWWERDNAESSRSDGLNTVRVRPVRIDRTIEGSMQGLRRQDLQYMENWTFTPDLPTAVENAPHHRGMARTHVMVD
jgi:hypothetical protein